MEESPHPIGRAIDAARAGDLNAASTLIPLLYDQLRDLARRLLTRRPPGQTLQATALVHEAYLRVAGKRADGWEALVAEVDLKGEHEMSPSFRHESGGEAERHQERRSTPTSPRTGRQSPCKDAPYSD